MKKLALTFIAAVVLAVVAKGQDTAYQSVFGNVESKWYIAGALYEMNDYNIDVWVVEFDLTDSSRRLSDGWIACSPSPYTDVELIESEDHSKLYSRRSGYQEEEYLIMDLNLQEGDSFYMPYAVQDSYFDWDTTIEWAFVDSVYYKEGRKHIKTNYKIVERVSEATIYLEFIEGVGPTLGLSYYMVHPSPLYPLLEYLTCYYRDSIEVYHYQEPIIDHFGECEFHVAYEGIPKTEMAARLRVYPNPSKGRITITGQPSGRHALTITGACGEVYLRQCVEGASVDVDVSKLPPQVYFVTMQGDAYLATIKFIKL